jgi:hypothetical protein
MTVMLPDKLDMQPTDYQRSWSVEFLTSCCSSGEVGSNRGHSQFTTIHSRSFRPRRLITMELKQINRRLVPARWFFAAALAVAATFPHARASTITDANWTPVGSGLTSTVLALAVSGSNTYAGGSFTNAEGSNYVARWDGSSWTQLGAGMNGAVRALAVSGNTLYAGGSFTFVGGNPRSYIAKWDGTNWLGIVGGVSCDVYALAVDGTNLYAGGCFTTASGTTVNHVAKYNGSFWTAMGPGLTNSSGSTGGNVDSLAVLAGDVYAGGNFTKAGSNVVNYIAKWDGSNWSALGSGMGGGVLRFVNSMAVSGTNLYAGGLFSWATNSGGASVTVSNIAKWNGAAWTNLSSGLTFNLGANSLAVSGNDLYAGGSFQFAGGNPASALAKWDGTNWTALGSGVAGGSPPTVYALTVAGNDLYVGGAFTNAGGKSCSRIARAYLGTVPLLSLARSNSNAVISWPAADTDGFTLEQAAALGAGAIWVSNTASIVDDGTNRSVTVPATQAAQFFRFRRP